MSDSESDNPQKKVTREFRDKVIKWIEIDDSIRELRAKTKELTTEKKQYEEYILSYMDQIEEKCFNIKDGKLRKNVSKTKGPLKKQIIHQALVEIVGDANKATAMTEHIINSRPTVERVNLKRTKNRGPRKK
tara:strand:- start:249 stop:644 length:396 start_codon:yes stop_codon:yes gene_type:complete